MADPFVAEIRINGFNFAPNGWAFCDGQILPISQNTALFSLLGTNYGGDGRSTFGLPDLQGRAPMHPGQGPGLSQRDLGESGGVETHTLQATEMPAHTHNLMASTTPASVKVPSANVTLARSSGGNVYVNPPVNLLQMSLNAVGAAGGSLPHNNMQPFLALNFCIALTGVFPPRG